MIKIFAQLKNRYHYSWLLLKELVRTDFKLRYKGSMIGMAWSVLKPLMLFAVMYVVFVQFLKFGANIPHFAVSLLLAQTLWIFFQESTSNGMKAIVDRGDLLRKINFPKYIVVLSATASAFINLLISLVVVIIFMVINGVVFRWTMLLFPFLIIELYMLALGVAFLLGTIYVKFRDIGHIWDVLAQILFYATPIIYPIELIMATYLLAAKVILAFNPIAQLIQDARYVAVTEQTATVWSVVGDGMWMLRFAPFLIVIMIFAIGAYIFKRKSPNFAEEV